MPRRTSIYLTDEDIANINHVRTTTGLNGSEVLRLLLAAYARGEIQHQSLPPCGLVAVDPVVNAALDAAEEAAEEAAG